jgi:CRP-like cAMP-binding protein
VTQSFPSDLEAPRASIRDRILVLRSFENFAGLDNEALTLIAEHARARVFRKGDVICEEGEAPRWLQLVVEGQLTVTRRSGASLVVPSGHGFGLLPIVGGGRTGRAVADVDTRTLEIPATALLAALEENFSLLRSSLLLLGRSILRSRGNLPAAPDTPPSPDPGPPDERPSTPIERLLKLRTTPFGSISIDALLDLSRQIIECRVEAGHVFWSAGDPSTHALHVNYGQVRCTASDGRYVDVGSNFTLGVMDLWGAQVRSYEARALTSVSAWRVNFEDFLAMLETHVAVGLSVLQGLARMHLATTENSDDR